MNLIHIDTFYNTIKQRKNSKNLKIKDCTQTTESRGKQWPLTADPQ